MHSDKILQGVLAEFHALCGIPRPSGHEEAVSGYLVERLRAMGFSPERDAAWNVICDVPASTGLEREGRLVLQAHTDMVCVGAADYDPLRDPIQTELREGWLCTDGRSSLGADCGIGLAAAMYLVASGMAHGPLRMIFTADEERGLAGAQRIRRNCLEGCDGLINLDSFHFGQVLISSAGGIRQTFVKRPEVFFPMLSHGFRLKISGLKGGHSGDDIGLGRGNAVRLLIWLLQSLTIPYELASLQGGTAHNAIPAEAEAVICIDGQDEAALRRTVEEFWDSAREIYGEADPDIKLSVMPAEVPQWVLTVDQRDDLLALAGLIQCGPWEEHPLCPGCVGSSGSMGRVFADSTGLELYSFLRSYDNSQMDQRAAFYETAAEGFGFSVEKTRYGAWPGVREDPLTAAFFSQRDGLSLEKSAVHVGLEASVFHELAPELPIVSVGMEIVDPHSVHERVQVDTIVPFVRLLGRVAEHYTG